MINIKYGKFADARLVELLIENMILFSDIKRVHGENNAVFMINGCSYGQSFYHFLRLTNLLEKHSLFELACFFATMMREGSYLKEQQINLLNYEDDDKQSNFLEMEATKERIVKYAVEILPNELSITFGEDPRGGTIYVTGIKKYENHPFCIPNYQAKSLNEVYDNFVLPEDFSLF